MVTAKKTSTSKPAAVATPPAAKTVAVKKTVTKKSTVSEVIEKVPAVVAEPSKTVKKPSTKTKSEAKPKTGTTPTVQGETKPSLSPEQRKHYVEVAAFYIAERRGFAPGNPAEDWIAAELEVDRLIASGQFN